MEIKHFWLTKELKAKVKKVFEPRYGRKLSGDEIVEIANNLVGFVENNAKFRWEMESKNYAAS